MLIEMLSKKNFYDDFLTYNYVLDIIQLQKEFNTNDASLLYYDLLEKKEDVTIAISEAALALDEELEYLYSNNKDDELFYNISKVFYIYITYLDSNKEEGLENALRITKIMESDLKLFLKSIKTNYDDRQTVMMWFYEFISLSDVEKDYILSNFSKLQDLGKVKIFTKKK